MLEGVRVIGGAFRSRGLVTPAGTATRPTSDRLRETLFNVLGERVPSAHFADLYAGAGAVGIEALSRGASSCLFVERAAPAIAAIRKNLTTLGLDRMALLDTRAVKGALSEALRLGRAYDLVFLDPPYEAAAEYSATLHFLGAQGASLVSSGGLVVAEHAKRSPLMNEYGRLRQTRLLQQGDAGLSFYMSERGPEA